MNYSRIILFLCIVIYSEGSKLILQDIDVSSLSNFHEVKTKHFELDIKIDFEKQIFSGTMSHRMESQIDNLRKVYLDIKFLNIEEITMPDGELLKFKINVDKRISTPVGDQLEIILPTPQAYKSMFTLDILYSTKPPSSSSRGSRAMTWLTPEQTTSGKSFVFTQCSATHCRTVAPMQDSPSVRSTFLLRLEVPQPLKAVASAIPDKPIEITKVHFVSTQSVPVPSYLLAIVAGDIQYKKMGGRTGIYAEPQVIDAAAEELSKAPLFITTAERLLIPYLWKEYNLAMMPPSFPFGGMENPYLTFASPTLIVGDKSQEKVIAHEIAHSWTGNLVTIQNWQNFWLKEGVTVYLERRIVEKIYGRPISMLGAYLGYQNLLADIKTMGKDNPLTALMPNLTGLDPNDVITHVPYEKGYLLHKKIEDLIGEEAYVDFLKVYISSYLYQSIGAVEYKNSLIGYIQNNYRNPEYILSQIEWDKWFFNTGYPIYHLDFNLPIITRARNLADKYIKIGNSPRDYKIYFTFDSGQKTVFLLTLKDYEEKVTKNLVLIIENNYQITKTEKSAEILGIWYQLIGLKKLVDEYYDELNQFLGSTGRTKYIAPVYGAVAQTNKPLALQLFAANRKKYSSIAIDAVEKVLNI